MTTTPLSTPTIQPKHDPVRLAHQLRDQLASARRRTALFLGAGTSISAGIPGLDDLTRLVDAKLPTPSQTFFRDICASLGTNANLELVLNHLRIVQELLAGRVGNHNGLDYGNAQQLDSAICRIIYEKVAAPTLGKLHAHMSLATWLRYIRRDSPVEVFTTNYDLLLEIAFETASVPFFDGFVGSVSPFFVPECIDADAGSNTSDVYPPRSWIRLWKLHGSVNWQLVPGIAGEPGRICRVTGKHTPASDAQLLIYPSRNKYAQSRRLPFVAYMDRLRRFLQFGEGLLLIAGYSFRDEHINEVLAQGLRSNPRLAVTAVLHDEPTLYVLTLAELHKNLSILSPNEASVGGVHGGWITPPKKLPDEQRPFWNDASSAFVLGDFTKLAEFLNIMTGYADTSALPTAVTGSGAVSP